MPPDFEDAKVAKDERKGAESAKEKFGVFCGFSVSSVFFAQSV